ncbi:YjcZ family sporulation protein [Bacillus massiliigorillae]
MGDSCCGGVGISGFALIVTLFILLVIVGAAWC